MKGLPEEDEKTVKFSISLPLQIAFHYCKDGSHFTSLEWDRLEVTKRLQAYTLKDKLERRFFSDAKKEMQLIVNVIEALLNQDIVKLAEVLEPLTNAYFKQKCDKTLDDFELKEIDAEDDDGSDPDPDDSKFVLN